MVKVKGMGMGRSQGSFCARAQYKRFKKLLKKTSALPVGNAISPVLDSPGSSSSVEVGKMMVSADLATLQALGLQTDADAHAPEDSLIDRLPAVVAFYKLHAQKVLHRRFASGWCKPLVSLGFMKASRSSILKEGLYVISYASLYALAIRQIERRVEKRIAQELQSSSGTEAGTNCQEDLALRSKLSTLHSELRLLQSPLLVELIAAYADSQGDHKKKPLPAGFQRFSFQFEGPGVKPTLSCVALDSFHLDFELTCSICLETLFLPVALGCGHVFCHRCACSTASVTAFEGLESAKLSAKCPLCRQAGVYPQATVLPELCRLIKHRCRDYWREQCQKERACQMREIKEFYKQELRASMGYATIPDL